MDELKQLAERRIFFGHQSVGENILAGVQRLSAKAGVPLQVEELPRPSALPGARWAHAKVGQNEDPRSKLKDFERWLDEGVGPSAQIAFMKFCYIDFDASTQVEPLFESYKTTHAALKARHPRLTVVHVTVPLTTVQRGAKGWLKNVVGSGAWGERENVVRHRFNELLRKTYGGTEPLFDLARAEATLPSGDQESFERDGKRWPALVAGYSNDGQHLNEVGQARVAAELVRFLAKLPVPPAAAAAQ